MNNPNPQTTAEPTDPSLPPQPQPQNARQAVALTREDHNWKLDRPELNSTDGIKRNINALWDAVDRLAGYIDGDKDPAQPKDPAQLTDSEVKRNGNNTKRT